MILELRGVVVALLAFYVFLVTSHLLWVGVLVIAVGVCFTHGPFGRGLVVGSSMRGGVYSRSEGHMWLRERTDYCQCSVSQPS